MIMRKVRRALCAGIAGLSALTALATNAADYPTHPIRYLVAFAPGGINDIMARIVAEKLTEAWGQPVIVDNRPGADGIIATNALAKAEPDGHTLLLASIGFATVPSLGATLPYDPARDFVPVIYAAEGPMVLATSPPVPATTLAELLALARAQPDKLNYGSGGIGSSNHLGMALLNQAAGVRMHHVPYKGAAPATTDLLADRIQLMLNPISNVLPYLKSGKLRALGVTTAKRSPAAPDVPAIAETVPGFDVSLWSGVFAPKGTPPETIAILNRAIAAALAAPDVRAGLAASGFEAVGGSSQAFGIFVDAELKRWADLVAAAGIKAE